MTLPAPPFASCFSASNSRMILGLAAAILFTSNFQSCNGAFYGKSLGRLTEFHHGVSGEVFAVDGRTLYLKDFTYDGEGPAAYFYAGNSKGPIINGFRIRDERGTHDNLRRYRKEDITLTLPEGKTLGNIRWFAIWCDDFSVNFGDVRIPRGFDYPKPQKLGSLKGIHGVSSEPIVVVDAQTLLIPGFSYDGEAPDAKFWAGPGANPTPQGIKVPDENGKVTPLRKYDQKTIVLTLPGDLTVHQLGHFGVWCEAFTVDFGHVKIPQTLNVPPSLKMLGVSPQNMRGQGQGQLAKTANQLSVSSTSSSSAQDQQDEDDHRVTTYRPILRRNDDVQFVQSVDYRIPKSIHGFQEPLQQVPQAPFIQQFSQNPQDYILRRDGQLAEYQNQNPFSQLQQFANVRTSFSSPSLRQQQPYANQIPQFDYQQNLQSNNYYNQELARQQQQQQQQQQIQQGSYARFSAFQGNQNLNSFVRY